MAGDQPSQLDDAPDDDSGHESPLDFCGWCFESIDRDAEHIPHALDRSIANPGNSYFFEGRIDDHLVFGIVPQPGCIPAYADAGAVVILCSEMCRAELQIAVIRHQRRGRGETVPPLIPSPAKRARAEELLKHHCAWCLAPLDDALVETVPTRIPDLDIEPGGVLRVAVGDRMVHGLVAPPGFLPDIPDHNVFFVTCSRTCSEALSAAIRDDLASLRPH